MGKFYLEVETENCYGCQFLGLTGMRTFRCGRDRRITFTLNESIAGRAEGCPLISFEDVLRRNEHETDCRSGADHSCRDSGVC